MPIENPYTTDELKALLTERVRQHYNNSVPENLVSDLAEAADPGRLTVALIEAIAEIWGENNRRLKALADSNRKAAFKAGANRY